ncbi:MAG: AAA family ATPase [Muribaculaceae bacterium]|nr:AAA family ATPase [Corallococcus sp.]MCM1296540.1 AAA family ATPase [Muribaculaceae bacterium]
MNNFDKVIGYENEKEEMLRLCDVLKNSEKYIRLGVKIPKAILLYGEPGLGKTLMAKAFIAETGRKVFHCKKNKSNGEFVNEIKKTFEDAIQSTPSIIFFDDMDKFAEDNLQQNCNKEEFIAIQTGLEDIADKDVFVIATANDIYYLPDSLMREGRFGKQIEFSTPSFEDSVKIIEHFLKDKHISAEITARSLAHILFGSSCAVLESVINEAGIYAAYANQAEITYTDVKRAVARVVLKRYELKDVDDKKKWRISYHEAGHAVLHLLSERSIGSLAIGKCGKDGLGVGMCCLSKVGLRSNYQESENYVMSLLAGKASVEIQFDEIDLGTTKDLQAAMNEIEDNLEWLASNGFEYLYLRDIYSNAQSIRQIDKNQEKKVRLMEEFYNRTKMILLQNKQLLDVLAQALYEKEVLLYDEINEIVKGVYS